MAIKSCNSIDQWVLLSRDFCTISFTTSVEDQIVSEQLVGMWYLCATILLQGENHSLNFFSFTSFIENSDNWTILIRSTWYFFGFGPDPGAPKRTLIRTLMIIKSPIKYFSADNKSTCLNWFIIEQAFNFMLFVIICFILFFCGCLLNEFVL